MLEPKGNVLLWDNYFVNEELTTLKPEMVKPIKRESLIKFDRPYEGDYAGYFHVVKFNDTYRMYYRAQGCYYPTEINKNPCICCLESNDGVNWHRLDYVNNKRGFEEVNNIVYNPNCWFDNFTIFYDENPDCPKEEKFKALVAEYDFGTSFDLVSYFSSDGLNFTRGDSIFGKIYYTEEKYRYDVLCFDSLNVGFYDLQEKKYKLYVRGFHNIPSKDNPPGWDADRNLGIRDIRYSESLDFKTFTWPKNLVYDKYDFPMYTNNIEKYYNSNNMYIGFPTRYVERKEWNDSFDSLGGIEHRKMRMKSDLREGLAVTETCFMYSRDGINFTRFPEAYFTPGEEQDLTGYIAIAIQQEELLKLIALD